MRLPGLVVTQGESQRGRVSPRERNHHSLDLQRSVAVLDSDNGFGSSTEDHQALRGTPCLRTLCRRTGSYGT
jgi:hypothetical protein